MKVIFFFSFSFLLFPLDLSWYPHRMQEWMEDHAELSSLPWSLWLGNTFQNLSVSSPAPVTMVCPSGDMAKYKTRSVCPVSVVSFVREGDLHTMNWFCEYPCVQRGSFTF